ncbi:hypothetical protein IIV22A_145L [Invertebrate iridescent virus 22]|uniref:Uncharacterized protein n=1 Tax=Invertebrate iridescent virus 22 TaxID=345198 RepID=W8W2R3_9VIRU|nr:hypothetical protein IIV22A_145L [Invertebrate iridescent virus 22]CCV01989.1 hypothetical protein IIV22A_145L [Invertebrate iridescent virus 22]
MISYSALTSYGKATLPSVEGWNGNFDIVKDPPSGIHTRRIIKVGENNDLLDWNEESGSRINEMINIYARGNNPMVSVQYSNHGNTGSGLMGVYGGTSGNNMNGVMTSGSGGKLPYRIMNEGAFRPPILRQEDLLPLSRMPRVCTSVTSKRCRVDQTKRIEPDVVEYFKEIHKSPIRVSTESNKSFKKEGPQAPPSNIDLMINNRVTTNVNSNVKKLKDEGDHLIPTLNNTLLVTNTDHINQKRISQQKYLNTNVFLSKNVPNYQAQTTSNLNIQKNKNMYELGGQSVALTNNRPSRKVSGFSAHSGGTMTKLNQEKIINGATLKTRGIH